MLDHVGAVDVSAWIDCSPGERSNDAESVLGVDTAHGPAGRGQNGTTGLYDFDLTIDLQTYAAVRGYQRKRVPAAAWTVRSARVMTQLQEDLGLKLDSQRGPGEVLVIDSAELPMPIRPSSEPAPLSNQGTRARA